MPWLAVLIAALALAGCGPVVPEVTAERPNIVFVLADDLSWDLLRHMPQVRRLQREGMTFGQFIVADSRCCTSRATILTGQFPHNTRVLTNTPPDGGYFAFRKRGARRRSVGIALRRAGYRTALMGKHLNGYAPPKHSVDAGWDEWLVSGNGYDGFGYMVSDNGRLRHFGHRPRDYMTDLLARRGARFIRRAARRAPFFLNVASFTPHWPYAPAPRHRWMRPRRPMARGAAFGGATRGAPSWLGDRPPLSRTQRHALRWHHTMRVRSVQALDELVGRLRDTLRRQGLMDHTYFVFTSDNGYHLGQHRLMPGKRTAFDHDVRVPLIVVGPGVRAGARSSALAGAVDLAPTFEDWAGLPPDPRRDGRSLAPILTGRRVEHWRRALVIEHAEPGDRADEADPDRQYWAMGVPSSYTALRTAHTTYVEYENGDLEFYDRRRDPGELDNRAGLLDTDRRAELHATLERYRRCRGPSDCWAAGR